MTDSKTFQTFDEAVNSLPADVNWRKIIMAYMQEVVSCEGVTFVRPRKDGTLNWGNLTSKENDALAQVHFTCWVED